MNARTTILIGVAVTLLVVVVGRSLVGAGDRPPDDDRRRSLSTQSQIDQAVAEVKSSDEAVAWQAVTDLGRFDVKAVSDTLIEALNDPRERIRMAAARSLGRIEVWEAMPALIHALNDPSLEVRRAAHNSVTRIIGIEFGYDPEDSPAMRRKFVAAMLENYQNEYAGYKLWQERKAAKNR